MGKIKCLIIYYTGTGNSEYLSNMVRNRLLDENYDASLYKIDPLNLKKINLNEYDIIGVCYPIYGFNLPKTVHYFFKKQKFKPNQRVFIFKNSGETYSANDSSSLVLRKIIKKQKACLTNEYHFLMPYNIHFRFDEYLVKEMLQINSLLLDILVKEINENIPNIKKYKFINNVINRALRLTYIGGNINVLFYKVDKNKCINCGLCIQKCPTKNIYLNKREKIKFKSNCLMCMNCTLNCPKDAIKMGLFNAWRVNKPYDFHKIEKLKLTNPIINDSTQGFFKCYVKTYKDIKNRHKELFGK